MRIDLAAFSRLFARKIVQVSLAQIGVVTQLVQLLCFLTCPVNSPTFDKRLPSCALTGSVMLLVSSKSILSISARSIFSGVIRALICSTSLNEKNEIARRPSS